MNAKALHASYIVTWQRASCNNGLVTAKRRLIKYRNIGQWTHLLLLYNVKCYIISYSQWNIESIYSNLCVVEQCATRVFMHL